MLFKYHPWQSQWAGAHQSTCPCLLARSSKASIFTSAHYAELLAGLSPKWGEKGKQTQNFIECHQAWAAWFVSTEILLQGSSSWIWLSWCPLDSSAESSWVWGHKKEQPWFLGIQMTTWITFFFPPPLSHLMVLFENARGQAKSLEEGSLPTFNKNYRCQREFCLSSNWSSDPRIWCMTTHFYYFCINAEKWPPCLLNHMKHLNQSSPPACSGKK